MDIDSAYSEWKDHAARCAQCTAAATPPDRCSEGKRLTFYADTSNIRTSIGPYPPSRLKDPDTYIWSTCTLCGWYVCHNEYRNSMQHTIEVNDHARSACAERGQLSLFSGV
ncbi:hypothetical protein ACVWZD_000379 [Streptomyces sp. TE3672]